MSNALIHDLWWFIENVTDDTPDKTERFFVLRERVREVPATRPSRVLVIVDGGIVQQVGANFPGLEVVIQDNDKHADETERVLVRTCVADVLSDECIDEAIAEDTRNNTCQVCDGEVEDSDQYHATPCGTFCDECMAQHVLECGVCASEFRDEFRAAAD